MDESDEALTEPYFFVAVLVDEADGKTYKLPLDRADGPSDEDPLVVFAAGAGEDANEVSSAEPGAAGTVRVVRASCDPTPVLKLEVDTTLGSEVEQGTEKLVGTYG